jgi:hypothetical protein
MTWLIVTALGVALYWYLRRDRTPKAVGIISGPGDFDFDIVGEASYQTALRAIAGPKSEDGVRRRCTAYLILEDSNPHDRNAVRVDIDGLTVGYLDRRMAKQYRAELARQKWSATMQADAVIVGGWKRGRSDEGSYGVKLDLPVR